MRIISIATIPARTASDETTAARCHGRERRHKRLSPFAGTAFPAGRDSRPRAGQGDHHVPAREALGPSAPTGSSWGARRHLAVRDAWQKDDRAAPYRAWLALAAI